MVMPFLNANRFSRLPESVCVSGLWKDSRWAPLDVLIPALSKGNISLKKSLKRSCNV